MILIFILVAILLFSWLIANAIRSPINLSGRGDFLLITDHSVNDILVYGVHFDINVGNTSKYESMLGRKQWGELRGMTINNEIGDLYFASSVNKQSKILRMSDSCDGSTVEVFTAEYIEHPYALATYNGTLFVTNQNGNSITHYSLSDAGIIGRKATFAVLWNPRGLVIDSKGPWLYAVSKGEETLIKYGLDGSRNRTWFVPKPLGLAIGKSPWSPDGAPVLWVGSNLLHTVTAIDTGGSGDIVTTYGPVAELSHPTGITIRDNVLYVISQDKSLVVMFDLETTAYLGVFLRNLPARPEDLLFVDGC